LGSSKDEPVTISVRPGGCSSWRVCLPWLSCTLNNSKLSWVKALESIGAVTRPPPYREWERERETLLIFHVAVPSLVRLCKSRQSDLEVKTLHLHQAKLYNTCILAIFLYGSECWAVTKRDVHKIDALNRKPTVLSLPLNDSW